MNPPITVLDTGLVYRNPVPHLQSRQAFFPSVVSLPNGELVVAMDIGSAFEAIDVRSYLCRSTDGGQTWSEPQLIFAPDESRHPVSTTCRISRMPDGNLVGVAGLFDRTRTESGLANPATEGFINTAFALVRSGDGGRNWSKPVPVEPPVQWDHFESCSPIIAVAQNRWLLPTSFWPDWEGRCLFGAHQAVVFLSEDRGKTWPRLTSVMDGSAEKITSWEQKLVTLSDGRLLSVCWRFDYRTRQNLANHYALSRDNGDTFGQPLATPLQGETCTPLALPDNHLLCIYRRTDVRGLWAHLARIDGDDWHPLHDYPVWGAQVEADGGPRASRLAQMSTLRFGCPSVTSLGDREVLVVFWCGEDFAFNIRWYKLKLAI
jgi:hypothetical protein